MHCLEGGFYMAGLVFISLETVLPSFVQHLGGADLLIAFMPVVLPAAFAALGLFTAPLVERMHRLKPFVITIGVLQRLPYLIAGLIILLVPLSKPALLWVILLAPILSGLIGGLSSQAWMEMMTRMIPPHRRASSWAARYQLASFMGLGAGVVIHEVLAYSPNAHGYAMLHLICSGFLVVSITAQSFMIEPPGHTPLPPRLPRQRREHYLRSLPSLLGAQPVLIRLIFARFTGMGYLMMISFLSIHALEVTRAPDADKGLFVSAQMAGSIVGSIFAARLGDRHGGRSPMLFARVLCVGLCVALWFTQSFAGFLAAFFVLNFGLSTDRVGDQTLAAELCPYQRRPTYQSLLGFCQILCLITATQLSGEVFHLTHSFHAVILLCAVLSAISVVILHTIPEVRVQHHAPDEEDASPVAQ